MLYLKALNTIYVIIKEALYFAIFFGDLTCIGFKLNPYDPFVANTIININLMTVVWHVDDIKEIHKIKKLVIRMENLINKTYERLFEYRSVKMKISRGELYSI